MSPNEEWTPWRRVGTPKVAVQSSDNSRVSVRFDIHPRDEGRWREYFEEWLNDNGIRGGIESSGMGRLGAYLDAPKDAFEIAVREADKAIEYANNRYREIDLPEKLAAQQKRADEQADKERQQRELDERAAKLEQPRPPRDW